MFDVIFWIIVVPIALLGVFMGGSFIVALINPKTRHGTIAILKDWLEQPPTHRKRRRSRDDEEIIGLPWMTGWQREERRKKRELERYFRKFE